MSSMDIRNQIRGAPHALKETLEKGRPEYDGVVRRTRWGDGPLFIVGSGSSFPTAQEGFYAFQELLGWPVVAVRAANFLAYSASTLRPRSVVMVIASGEEADAALEAARQARARGAAVLAMTHDAAGPLAESADGVFLIRPEEGNSDNLQAELCRHAAMGFLAVAAANVLKRRHQKLDELTRDYERLPEHAEWVLTHLSDAARSLASELGKETGLVLAGGGPYFAAAMQATRDLNSLGSIRARAVDAAVLADEHGNTKTNSGALMFLSGSRSRFRKPLVLAARKTRRVGSRIFSITDANDHELTEDSSLAVLLPGAGEMPGSALALFFVQCTIAHLSHSLVRSTKQSAMKPPGSKGKPKVL